MSQTDNNDKTVAVGTEERARLAEEALQRKYQHTFVVAEVYPQKYGELFYQVQAYAEEYPLLRFAAYVDMDGGDVSDAYVEKRVCNRIKDQVMRNIDGLRGFYDVYVMGIGPQPYTTNADISISDYVALDADNDFKIFVFYNPEEKKQDDIYNTMMHIVDDLEELTGYVRLCIADDELLKEIQEYFELNDSIYSDFYEIDKRIKSCSIRFRAGEIDINKDQFLSSLGEMMA